jgi:hypothetical protein
MELLGIVDHGVIVPQGDVRLPEGVMVRVVYDGAESAESAGHVKTPGYRVKFPLVKTGESGTLHLTNERIAEIFDEEDFSPRR